MRDWDEQQRETSQLADLPRVYSTPTLTHSLARAPWQRHLDDRGKLFHSHSISRVGRGCVTFERGALGNMPRLGINARRNSGWAFAKYGLLALVG